MKPIYVHEESPQEKDVRTDRTLLFIHGDFSNGLLTWSRQRDGLPTSWRLLIVDRRGHGESPLLPRPYTIAQDARDILAVVRERGGGAVHLIGHSYGGLVALEAAVTTPLAVRSLHLIEPPYLTLAADSPSVTSLTDATRQVRKAARDMSPDQLADAFFSMLLGEEGHRRLRERPVWSLLVREAERFAHEEFAGEYPSLRLTRLDPNIPLTIYTGARSHPGLRDVAMRLGEAVPTAHIVSFPSAGHDVQRDESFNTSLLERLSTSPAPR